MAIAGPVVTVVLGMFFWSLFAFGKLFDWSPAIASFCFYLGWVNSVILLFNLIPAFPLDGGRVLRAALWGRLGNLRRATYWASASGQTFASVLIGFGVLNFIFGDVFSGVWFSLIGLFLNNAAKSGYEQVLIQQALRGEPVRRFMTPHPVTVSPWINLREWVEDVVYRYHHKCYPVVEEGLLQGMITTKQLEQVAREDWPEVTVAKVMRRDLDQLSVTPDSDAFDALQRMQQADYSRLLVVDDGELVGLLSLRDLLKFLDLKLQLDGESHSAPMASTRRKHNEKLEVHS
jgi:CBS domain-containing protein